MRLAFCALISLSLTAHAAPKELWLTMERASQLQRIARQPYVTKIAQIGDGSAVYHWTNGGETWVTTQKVHRIRGAKAESGWSKKLASEKKKTDDIIESVRKMSEKGAATKRDLLEIIEKADKQETGRTKKGK